MQSAKFQVNETFGKQWQFDEKSVKEFAILAGDLNPLHHDETAAKNSRFSKLIVSGRQYVAMMMGVVATFVSARQSALGLEFNFQLKKAIFANEAIDIQWKISKIEFNKKLNGNLIYFEGILYNSKQEVCTIGRAKLLSVEEI